MYCSDREIYLDSSTPENPMYVPYLKTLKGVDNPRFKPFNSFSILVPACCQLYLYIDNMESIFFDKMSQPYVQGFGPFDTLLSKVRIKGSCGCISDVVMSVQRSANSPPPNISVAPIISDNECQKESENDNGLNGIEIVCFKRTIDSPLERGFMVLNYVVSGDILKTLTDENNDVVDDYIIVNCC